MMQDEQIAQMDSSWSTNSGHPLTLGRNSLDCEYLNNPPSLSPPSPSCKVASLRCRTDLTRENFFANHHNIYIYIYSAIFISHCASFKSSQNEESD